MVPAMTCVATATFYNQAREEFMAPAMIYVAHAIPFY
jgi:hypothetical protein